MSEPKNTAVKHRVLRATPEEYLVVVLMSDGWLPRQEYTCLAHREGLR